MIAPLLPGAENLIPILAGKVDHILVDRMNYRYADHIYKKYGMEDKLTDEYFERTGKMIEEQCQAEEIPCRIVF